MARTGNRASKTPSGASDRRAKAWRAGIYMRLSREEAGRGDGDSNSIVHQRRLLREFCEQHRGAFESVTEYADDGCSGTDTRREQFQRMLADVMGKRIDCVIVKDLSRLSRNYSDAGSLIESLFVEMDVRFISLSEGIDSHENPDSVSNLIVPITNVMNDNFCYQTSRKVRQVFDHKRRIGEFIGGFAPYGYIKDPRNKHALLVDGEAAETVRLIFGSFLGGMSKQGIVHMLNARGIPPPSAYKREKGLNYRNPSDGRGALWSPMTVTTILKNRTYIGDMVQGRQRVKSYKVHKLERVPEDEWYVVENTHEPIVGRDAYDRVQALLARDTRTAPRGNALYPFSGFMRCADCGKAMARSRVGGHVYYFCRTYKDQSKAACTKHTIRHDRLEAAVLRALQMRVYLSADCDRVIAEIDAVPCGHGQAEYVRAQTDIRRRELAMLERHRLALYHDWKEGDITREEYRRLCDDYDTRIGETEVLLKRLEAERTELECVGGAEPALIAGFRRSGNVVALNREVIAALVDTITVHEGGSITIAFSFDEGTRTGGASPPR